jgi:replication-associated recombination protein RarA
VKQNQLVRIRNVVEADNCINYLINRPKLEMVGLGLLYGRPGFGKTAFAQRTAFQRGYIYLRLESFTTARTFATKLVSALYEHYEINDPIPFGTAQNLYKHCTDLLEEHPETVLIIDEIDYAFHQPKLLGAIRDIVDETLVIIILIGMQTARDRLSQLNEHYFDRCNAFVEFQPVSKKDIRAIAHEIMEIPVTTRIVDDLYETSKGNLRKAIKMMYSLESGQMQDEELPTNVIDL